MRGLRSFVLLLVIAIPLGWYAYRDLKKGPVDDSPKHDKVFAVDADKIDELEVKSDIGERTTLRRNGTAWEIVQPAAAAADEAAVSGITSNLSSVEIQRVIDENPSDLKEFGLAEPRVEVGFKSGGQPRKLQIGSKTPSGGDVYAKVADQKKVFLVSSYLDSTFNRNTFDLRDKSALKVDREKVDSIEVTADGRTTRFQKVNGEWQIAEPSSGRADFNAVDGLVSRLSGLQMKSMVPPDSPDQNRGLDKPSATVRLGSGSSQATLLLGATDSEDSVYAKDGSRPGVFAVERSLLTDLKKDPSDYRQKDLFDARSFNTTRVEVVRNGQTFAFEKTKTKDKDGKEIEKWRQLTPAARDVDAGKIEALMTAIAGARATRFVDSSAKTGLDRPELTVTLKFDEGKEERVTFARAGADAFAARPSSPGAAKVEPSVVDGIVKALEALK